MANNELIMLNEKNIRCALEDYARHTTEHRELDLVSDTFVHALAADNATSKQELREMFRKSPAWNEDLQAVVINGNRTHEPDMVRVYDLVFDLVSLAALPSTEHAQIAATMATLANGGELSSYHKEWLDELAKFDPNAYKPGKKPSKILRAVCKAYGIVNEQAGSLYQKRFALAADEMSSKKIDYKLFVSINPAHFLTMSNPTHDSRGETLISCHSLNTGCYRSGAIGYARDPYSFIVFTTADPNNPETLNNRKTTRQMFAYKPGNGALLQSRMYNTGGGDDNAKELSTEYRRLIEKEISDCENVPNLWGPPMNSANSEYSYLFEESQAFTGYIDFCYSRCNGVIAIRKDAEDPERILVGAAPLCVECGEEFDESNTLTCCDGHICKECGAHISEEDAIELPSGEYICRFCCDEFYVECADCGEIHPIDDTVCIDDEYVCEECLNEHYTQCADCGEWIQTSGYRSDEYYEMPDGSVICEGCFEDGYEICQDCGNAIPRNETIDMNVGWSTETYCRDCIERIAFYCEECQEWHFLEDGIEITDCDGKCRLVCVDAYNSILEDALARNDRYLREEEYGVYTALVKPLADFAFSVKAMQEAAIVAFRVA